MSEAIDMGPQPELELVPTTQAVQTTFVKHDHTKEDYVFGDDRVTIFFPVNDGIYMKGMWPVCVACGGDLWQEKQEVVDVP